MLGRRLPKSRKFSYTPYYYDPEKDKKKVRQIKFRRRPSKRSTRTRSLVWLSFLLVLVIYLIVFLIKLSQKQP